MNQILAQNNGSEQQIASMAHRFARKFRLGSLLRCCNASKQKGISAVRVFLALLTIAFSMYMSQRVGTWTEGMSKNTVYRFLNNQRINWERLMTELAARAVSFLEPPDF